MTKFTTQQLIRWTVDINGFEFAKVIYGRDDLDFNSDGYCAGKFKQMQSDLITWMANLDPRNKEILAQSIVSHSDEDGKIKPDSPLGWGKVIDSNHQLYEEN
jgi:hypothetical protein